MGERYRMMGQARKTSSVAVCRVAVQLQYDWGRRGVRRRRCYDAAVVPGGVVIPVGRVAMVLQ